MEQVIIHICIKSFGNANYAATGGSGTDDSDIDLVTLDYATHSYCTIDASAS